MRKVVITGGSGFLADALTERLLKMGVEVRLFSRNEGALILRKQKYPEIEIFTGDVCDPFEVRQACHGMDTIFHLAAFKHVGMAEKFSRECIKANVIGSLNVLDYSINNVVSTVVGISTDKAARVSGTYGASKFLMESLFSQYEDMNQITAYRIVRYGNVLYSTGSVLCKWKELIKSNKPCVITDPDATRFYWTVDQAVDLIFDCLKNSVDASPYCPTMKSIRVGDLYNAMVHKYAKQPQQAPIIIGIQPGENMHEKIVEDKPASNEVDRYSLDEILELI